jgi:putative DNA primase/helicase
MNDEPISITEAKKRLRQQAKEEKMREAEAEPDRPPEFSDEALALAFAERHADDLRYVAAWGRWLLWTGSHWRHDDTLRAFSLAREICRMWAATALEGGLTKVAAAVASAKTVAAVERLARADRRLAATAKQWDADPWVINTPGGIIDLRSGDLRDARPDDYCTHVTGVAPSGACPRFLEFLRTITGDDVELQDYLQRCLGYALTGSTSENALFFGYGTGANGKSVLIKTISGIMGSYHSTAPIETFTASSTDRHPTDLAGLLGARLVTAIETEEGRRWAESKIKTLTGGDEIAARFMRQDFFRFTPAFKLLIAGNHKPALRSVDEAIKRRFHLWPFAVTIPEDERDPDLADRLKAEWPGIFEWLIEGCLDWQTTGLAPPKAVTEATSKYLESEDAVSAWIEECCELKAGEWTSSKDLFASWKTWAENAGEFVGSRKQLGEKLESRSLEPLRRHAGVRGFLGLTIKPATPYGNGYGYGSDPYP